MTTESANNQIEAERDRLAEELRRRAELEQELKLNASMLARQCDLAREAETERDEAIQEKHRAWASLDHAIEENRKVEKERDKAHTWATRWKHGARRCRGREERWRNNYKRMVAEYNELQTELRYWRGCSSCLQDHGPDVMCPPHEVRVTGQAWRIRRTRQMAERAKKAEQRLATLAKRVAELEQECARDNKALKAVEAERDELKQRVAGLETEKQKIIETAIRLLGDNCCIEHVVRLVERCRQLERGQ